MRSDVICFRGVLNLHELCPKAWLRKAPDYAFLRERNLFLKVLRNIGETDDCVFDWCLLNNGMDWEYGNVGPVILALLRHT